MAESPLGMKAGLEAVNRLKMEKDEQVRALRLQLEQIEYEAKRAFEQANEVDPRNRRVGSELERRWNEKLEKVDSLKTALAEKDRSELRLDRNFKLGRYFADRWQKNFYILIS